MATPTNLKSWSSASSSGKLKLIQAGGEIPWVEHVQNESPAGMQLSRLQNSQATVTYMTPAQTFYVASGTNGANRGKLYTTILGGYWQDGSGSGVAGLRHQPPLRHPYVPGMWATEITDVTFKKYQDEVTDTENGLHGSFAAYEVAFVTILYQTLPFSINRDVSGGSKFNPNWISIENHASNTYVNAAIGGYRWAEGPWVNLPTFTGLYIRKPEGRYQVTIHNVIQDLIFTGSGAPWDSLLLRTPDVTLTGSSKTVVGSPAGFCNSGAFMGCQAETLLLDSVDLLPVGDLGGASRYYDVRLQLLYNGWGWNRMLDPFNRLYKIKSYGGGMPPYSTIDFDKMFDNFNPKTSYVRPPGS